MIEGSENKKDWRGYRFKYKPDTPEDLHFAWLHMPRLDWQMWFAALYPKCSRRWFFGFMHALLDGSKTVDALMEENPFPEKPPKYLRVKRVRAQFTDARNRAQTQHVWRFEPVSDYCPIVTKGALEKYVSRRVK
jgi:hypothetical protein